MGNVVELLIAPSSSEPVSCVDIRVLNSTLGTCEALTVPFDYAGFTIGQEVFDLVDHGGSAKAVLKLRQAGTQLFKTILTAPGIFPAYEHAVRKTTGLLPQLRIRATSRALREVLWEALYDETCNAHVCSIMPIIRSDTQAKPTGSVAQSTPLRILAVVAAPTDMGPLSAQTEIDHLRDELAIPLSDGLIDLICLEQATWPGLMKALQDGPWHVVHFIGHGGVDPNSGEGLLYLVDDAGCGAEISAHALCEALNFAGASPRLVVLNSCSGAAIATNPGYAGAADALRVAGIPAVVAMGYSIPDQAALAFTRGFYTALGHGDSIAKAVTKGRLAMFGMRAGSPEYLMPILRMGSDDFALLDKKSVATTVAPSDSDGETVDAGPAQNITAGTRVAVVIARNNRIYHDPSDPRGAYGEVGGTAQYDADRRYWRIGAQVRPAARYAIIAVDECVDRIYSIDPDGWEKNEYGQWSFTARLLTPEEIQRDHANGDLPLRPGDFCKRHNPMAAYFPLWY